MKIAIVGGGVSGVTALWALQRSHHDVQLFEASGFTKGLTQPLVCDIGRRRICTDTGLTVVNVGRCPNLMAFLHEIGLSVVKKGFNFSSTRQNDSFEMSWGSLQGVINFLGNFWDLEAWELRLEVLKFAYFARDVLRNPDHEDRDSLISDDGTGAPLRPLGENKQPHDEASLQSFLRRHQYSDRFIFSYLVPLLSIFWNIGDIQSVLDLPLETTLQFLWDNDLLCQPLAWPEWATLSSGSDFRNTMRRVLHPDKVHVDTTIVALISNSQAGKEHRREFTLVNSRGRHGDFDRVIFAIPPGDALRVLDGEATMDERLVLQGFMPTKTLTVFHSDTSKMPRSKLAWALVNHLERPIPIGAVPIRSCLTYWVTALRDEQHIETDNLFITINPARLPSAEHVHNIWQESRPVINKQALICQSQMADMQFVRGICFCGSWTGAGFYEDSVRSALVAATKHFGVKLPFEVVSGENGQAVHRAVPPVSYYEKIIRSFIKLAPLLLLAAHGALWLISLLSFYLAILFKSLRTWRRHLRNRLFSRKAFQRR